MIGQPHAQRTHGVQLYGTNDKLVELVVEVARLCAPHVRRMNTTNAPLVAWVFVRYLTEYRPDEFDQHIRTPRRFVRDRVGNCKSHAILVATLCKAAGHSVALRFVDQGGGYWSHVYAVVDGVPVDPLLEFGRECVSLRSHTVTL